ncbi:uncharacterized protein LOC141532138 [Cotesia typhae]|uniref:uncharacterized protein LOC141532138 n=1 Tax=Cotesia typhae TaxID=2053667 RepID=UPI003D686B87
MARQLFKLILGTDRLAKMSVTETKRHEKVPDKYLESIFEYVTIYTKSGMEISEKEFLTCVGRMLSGIREGLKKNTKNSKEADNKKSKNDDKKKTENDNKTDTESAGENE